MLEFDLLDVSEDICRLLDDSEQLDLSPSFRALLFAVDELLTATWDAPASRFAENGVGSMI